MPIFAFDEPQRATTGERIHVVDDTAVPSELKENPDTDVNQEPVCSTIIPSRSTKPIDTDLIIFLLIILPVCVAAIQFAFNPRVRSFFCARAAQLMHKPKAAIVFYSDVLNRERDAITLGLRADAYGASDDPLHQRDDLMDSIALNPNQDAAYVTAAGLQVRCGNPELAAPLLKSYANLPPHPINAKSWAESRNQQAAYNLLLLGDTKAASEFSNRLPDADAERTVLTSLISRQEKNLNRSREVVSTMKDSDEPHVYKDSRTSYREKTTKDSILAMLALDERKPNAARALLTGLEDVAHNSRYKDDMETPIIDVLQGWLLLEEGRTDECLKLSAKLLEDKQLNKSIEGLNIKAALYSMRYRAFMKQGNLSEALNEEDPYKATHSSGKLFTPVWAWND